MTSKGTTDIFSIIFGWSNILEYLSYADVGNVGALTNQNLRTAILEVIGDKSNKSEIKQRNPIMKSTKINQYAIKSMRSALKKYLSYVGLQRNPFLKNKRYRRNYC